MNKSNFKILDQDYLYQTEQLVVKSWKSVKRSANSKEEVFNDVLNIMTPDVTKDLPEGWQNITTVEGAEKWVSERKTDSHLYAVQIRDSKEMIGFLFLYIENETIETADLRLGYLLSKLSWGKGFGSELINGLVNWCKKSKIINSVLGGVDSNNIGSIRVLEKNGFVKTDDNLPDNMLLYKLIL